MDEIGGPTAPPPSDALLDALASLLENRGELPPVGSGHRQVRAWLVEKLGESWYQELDDVYNYITKTLPQKLTGLGTDIGNVPGHVQDKLNSFLVPYAYLKTLEQDFQAAVGAHWPAIETALRKGIAEVTAHLGVMQAIEASLHHYEQRCGYAIHSLEALYTLLEKGSPDGDLVAALEAVVFDPDKKGAEAALISLATFFFKTANPLTGVASLLLEQGFGDLWSRVAPFAFAPGTLDQWINAPSIHAEERDFRMEMVAAVDAYCRGRFGGGDAPPSTLRGSDARLGLQVLADLGSVLLSTFFSYVIRNPKLPSLTMARQEWAHPFASKVRAEDVGSELAMSLSRQLSYQLKSTLGLYLRGFWDVSTLNDSLVESVTGMASHTVGSLLEAFFHDLFWSVEIHETYSVASDCVFDWPTKEPVDGDPSSTLSFCVFARLGILSDAERDLLKTVIEKEPSLQALLRDYGAYLESVRDFRPDDRSGGLITDAVAITGVTTQSGRSVVGGTSTYPASFPSIPVLRCYHDGSYVVLKPTATASPGTTTYQCSMEALASGSMIYLRSSYGDMTSYIVP